MPVRQVVLKCAYARQKQNGMGHQAQKVKEGTRRDEWGCSSTEETMRQKMDLEKIEKQERQTQLKKV